MTSLTIPAEPRPEQITAIVDTREQAPLDVSPLQSVAGTLTTGDYSVQGLEPIVAIEREVQRLLSYPIRALVIESTWQEFEAGDWRSKIKPASVIGSLLGWSALGLPIVMAGTHQQAGRYVSRLLFIAARRRWREARALLGVKGGPA